MLTRSAPAADGSEAPASNVANEHTLSRFIGMGWAVGTTGSYIVVAISAALLLKYGVDNLGLTAAVAGSIMTVTRLFDALIDPSMGMISDRTKSPWGRRRPYLLLGGVMCAMAVVLLYGNLFNLAVTAPTLYFTVGLVWFAIAHTVFNVPHLTMSYELTKSPKGRTVLMSFRVYALALGTILGASVGPWLATYFGGGIEGFAAMAWILAGLVLVLCGISFVATKDAPVVTVSQETFDQSLGEKLRQAGRAIHNRPFVSLITAKSFYMIGTGIGSATYAFMITNVMGHSLAALGYLVAATMVGLICSQPMWVWMCNKVGKRKCFMIAAPFNALGCSTYLLSTSGEAVWIIVARALWIGVFGGGMVLCINAMLPDTLQHEYDRTGVPQEGTLAGIFTTIERSVQALGVAGAGLILSLGGYISGSPGIAQPSSAIWAIYICVGVLPPISILGSIFLMARYNLKH